jgi:abortive infection bacteriophage resistance protein
MFNKPPTSITEQIELLQSRGLLFSSDEECDLKTWLMNVNYYKLSGYWLIFEIQDSTIQGRSHKFKPGTTWKLVKQTYIFDQKFRKLIFTAIEKIEVSVKARWSQYLAMTYGPHPHENKHVFSPFIYDGYNHNAKASTYNKLTTSYQKSNTLYAKHYREHYPELKTPPIWVVSLIITFGNLVNWVKYLKSSKDRNTILNYYGFDERIMISFLTHLIEIRNICAHSGRLWNRNTNREFIVPKTLADIFIKNSDGTPSRKIYNTLLMMSKVLKIIDPNYPFLYFVKRLIEDNYLINPSYMGFPEDWKELPIWDDLIKPRHKK